MEIQKYRIAEGEEDVEEVKVHSATHAVIIQALGHQHAGSRRTTSHALCERHMRLLMKAYDSIIEGDDLRDRADHVRGERSS